MKNWTFNEMKADFSMDRILPREQVLAFFDFYCLPVILPSFATFVINDCFRLC